nr:hypothetical protein [Haladaptatus sp. R4]
MPGVVSNAFADWYAGGRDRPSTARSGQSHRPPPETGFQTRCGPLEGSIRFCQRGSAPAKWIRRMSRRRTRNTCSSTFAAEGSESDPEAVLDREWGIPAVENNTVHVLDDSLLNQPSPRLLDGIETMTRILHPDAVESND